jgi:hypothetical protein
LKVEWHQPQLRSGPPPLYVRVHGLADGELELRVDRDTGQLLVLVVLSVGPVIDEGVPALPEPPPETTSAVFLDSTLFPTADTPVLDLELLIHPYRDVKSLRLDFDTLPPVRAIDCGAGVTLGVAEDGTWVAMAATATIDDDHFLT